MLVTFSSKAAAPFIMLPVHAHRLLRTAGKPVDDDSLPVSGVFTPEQLPAAIDALAAAIDADPAPPEPDEDAPKPHPMDEPVNLARRAWPLLDMLRRARGKGVAVMWEVVE